MSEAIVQIEGTPTTKNLDTAKRDTDVQHKGTSVSSLAEGDRVRISATHQVKIDGLDAWIKIEVDSAVRADEDSTSAMVRVGKTIAANMVNEIERQAEVVYQANRRTQPF